MGKTVYFHSVNNKTLRFRCNLVKPMPSCLLLYNKARKHNILCLKLEIYPKMLKNSVVFMLNDLLFNLI